MRMQVLGVALPEMSSLLGGEAALPCRRVKPVPAYLRIGTMRVLAVRHTTTYQYRNPVSFGEHRIMFRPRDSYDQRLLESSLVIHPAPSSVRWMHDVFGNCV